MVAVEFREEGERPLCSAPCGLKWKANEETFLLNGENSSRSLAVMSAPQNLRKGDWG